MVGTVTQQPPKSNTPRVNQITETEEKDEYEEVVEEGLVTKYVEDEAGASTERQTRHW